MHKSLARRNLIARLSGEHCHEYPQILMGWRGRMECEFQRGAGLLSHGRIAVVPDNADHFFNGLSDDSELLVIDLAPADPYIQALEQACNLSFRETLFQQPEFIHLNPEMLPLLDFAASQLRQSGTELSPQLNCQLISLFMTQLCQLYSPLNSQVLAHKRLNAAQLNDYIDQRLAEPPDNGELAAALYLSESHLYYLCQREFGMTPQQYVMNRRMQRARVLLLNSRLPIADLAAELGFSEASSFSRAYKKHFGMPPGRARKASVT